MWPNWMCNWVALDYSNRLTRLCAFLKVEWGFKPMMLQIWGQLVCVGHSVFRGFLLRLSCFFLLNKMLKYHHKKIINKRAALAWEECSFVFWVSSTVNRMSRYWRLRCCWVLCLAIDPVPSASSVWPVNRTCMDPDEPAVYMYIL